MGDELIRLACGVAKYCYLKKSKSFGAVRGAVDDVAVKTMGNRVVEIVKRHQKVVGTAGLATAIPAGATVATGAIVASTWKMYVDINKELGLSFSENTMKSIATGVVSNLAGNAAASVGLNVLSTIPFLGQRTCSCVGIMVPCSQ